MGHCRCRELKKKEISVIARSRSLATKQSHKEYLGLPVGGLLRRAKNARLAMTEN
jgi:hypothetical protein